eukprot:Unigene4718_Nuclearia_a/m.14420 Unigene4718_Nuclearia_a/g.14420  ORF Unigene4718_Nuclearia_a/g.14420 Unigene4718_Nuclearia_a/m.14420 type:complete len:349 (-) Unigene4718_Nuclearia_a:2640-3686(-)
MGRTLSRLLAGVRVPRRATGATAGASASSQPPPYDAAEKKTTTTAEEPPRPRALTLTPSAEQLAALPFTVHVVYARGDEAFAQRLADDLERDAALAGCVRRPLAPSPAEAHLYASHAFVCVLSQRFYGDAACLSDVKHIARLREKKSRVFFFLLSLEGNLTMPMPFRFALGGDTIQRVDFSTGAYDDKLRKFAKPLVRRALEHRGEVPPASEGAADSTVLLFISYAVRNKETVWPLARFLRERAFGEHVWIDAEKIEAGARATSASLQCRDTRRTTGRPRLGRPDRRGAVRLQRGCRGDVARVLRLGQLHQGAQDPRAPHRVQGAAARLPRVPQDARRRARAAALRPG